MVSSQPFHARYPRHYLAWWIQFFDRNNTTSKALMMVDGNDMGELDCCTKFWRFSFFFILYQKDAYALGMDDFRGMGVALHWI